MVGRQNTIGLYKGIIEMNNIDAIYNMPEPDVGWIYKNPDKYKKESKH